MIGHTGRREVKFSPNVTARYAGYTGRDGAINKILQCCYWPDYYEDTIEMARLFTSIIYLSIYSRICAAWTVRIYITFPKLSTAFTLKIP